MVGVRGWQGQVPGFSTSALPGLRASLEERTNSPSRPAHAGAAAPTAFPVNAPSMNPEFLETAPFHSTLFHTAGSCRLVPLQPLRGLFSLLSSPPSPSAGPTTPRSSQGAPRRIARRVPASPFLLPCFLMGKSHVLSRCPIAGTTRFPHPRLESANPCPHPLRFLWF